MTTATLNETPNVPALRLKDDSEVRSPFKMAATRYIQARLMFGARVSLAVPIVVEAVVVLIGVPLGLIAGYFGGLVDDVVMRFTDIMFAFPGLLLVIILVSI